MTEGNFVDYVKLHVASGNGGSGSTHLRREKFVAKMYILMFPWEQ